VAVAVVAVEAAAATRLGHRCELLFSSADWHG